MYVLLSYYFIPFTFFPLPSLLDICNYQNRSDLMKLILSTLDFGHDTHSRVILSKILTSTVKVWRGKRREGGGVGRGKRREGGGVGRGRERGRERGRCTLGDERG